MTTAPRSPDLTRARRDAIRNLLRSTTVATQEQLRQQLEELGFQTTQATLSRDLARLGAYHAPLAGGGSAYALAEVAPASDPLAEIREMVLAIEDNGSLVVLHTRPGGASAVARAIDLARLPESLGTLAGDDTIFLAPRRVSAHTAARRLKRLFNKEQSHERQDRPRVLRRAGHVGPGPNSH
jgi:transcriptional regulator of arginine metabolism